MKIAGINKTTLLDYPEHIAATIFTAGCNFCCPFCHNSDLVINRNLELIPEQEVLAFLEKRKSILKGICITGGEPTLQPGLKDFIKKARNLGYLIKLDTNGYRPDVVENLLAENLLDYIAMDIKNSKTKYAITTAIPNFDIGKITASVEQILNAGINHEFRTTIVKELHTEADLLEIANWIAGTRHYYLQAYEENENVIQKGFHPYQSEELQSLAEKLTATGFPATVRGNSNKKR